jgi:hypothetical protein
VDEMKFAEYQDLLPSEMLETVRNIHAELLAITVMLIQMQKPITSPNGRQKHERNMETDTNKFQKRLKRT